METIIATVRAYIPLALANELATKSGRDNLENAAEHWMMDVIQAAVDDWKKSHAPKPEPAKQKRTSKR